MATIADMSNHGAASAEGLAWSMGMFHWHGVGATHARDVHMATGDVRTGSSSLNLSHDMRFPAMWHFDMFRLRH